MATYKIYKLHFTSPLHIGDKRDDEGVSMKTIQSDTLMAAITSMLARVGTEIPADGNLGFTVSSLFPYFQGKDDKAATYFLPMPRQSRLPNLKDEDNAKKVKKIRWVDTALYPRLLAGYNLFDNNDEHLDHIHGEFLTENSIPDKMMRSEVCQRVKVESRVGEADALPYYVDRITFAPGAGFYFLAAGDTNLLDKGMNILAMEGLGTDRSAGYGFFEFSTDELELVTPAADADYVVSLSLLIPADKSQLDELLAGEDVAYDFMRRGGWITSMPHQQLRKNAIYGFLPGSVFKRPSADVCGTIVDLAPAIVKASPHAHPVWRDGRTILLPIKR